MKLDVYFCWGQGNLKSIASFYVVCSWTLLKTPCMYLLQIRSVSLQEPEGDSLEGQRAVSSLHGRQNTTGNWQQTHVAAVQPQWSTLCTFPSDDSADSAGPCSATHPPLKTSTWRPHNWKVGSALSSIAHHYQVKSAFTTLSVAWLWSSLGNTDRFSLNCVSPSGFLLIWTLWGSQTQTLTCLEASRLDDSNFNSPFGKLLSHYWWKHRQRRLCWGIAW